MSAIGPTVQSLFARKDSSGADVARQARLEYVVQQFEGLLWNQVAQAMNAVQFGPSSLGDGGQAYQRMMWSKVTSRDFGQMSNSLTRATMNQLIPKTQTAPSAQRSGAPSASPQASATNDNASGNTPEQWVEHVWHAIESGAKALGVPAKGLLAQAALETGWGRNVRDNNLFGIKAHNSQDPSFTALTHEFADGVLRQVQAAFQSYRSAAHAVDDLVRVLRRFHPQALSQSTVAGYAQALQDSGYATDPRYAHKIEAVAAGARMSALLAAVK